MHEYVICNMPDMGVYQKQRRALEKHIPGLVKTKEVHDVDDGRITIYNVDGKEIVVKNSFYLGQVVVTSEIPLEPFFAK